MRSDRSCTYKNRLEFTFGFTPRMETIGQEPLNELAHGALHQVQPDRDAIRPRNVVWRGAHGGAEIPEDFFRRSSANVGSKLVEDDFSGVIDHLDLVCAKVFVSSSRGLRPKILQHLPSPLFGLSQRLYVLVVTDVRSIASFEND